MKIVLTGGIACGKSTFAKFLEELGIRVLDADDVVHDLESAHGAAVPAIVSAFGPTVLAPDGSIDRKKLADLVFPPGSVPTNPGSVPALSGSVPILQGSVPTLPGSVPALSGSVPTNPGSVPALPGSVPTIPGSVPTNPGSVPTNPGSVPALSGSVPTNPGSVPALPGSVPTHPGSVPTHPGSVPARTRLEAILFPLVRERLLSFVEAGGQGEGVCPHQLDIPCTKHQAPSTKHTAAGTKDQAPSTLFRIAIIPLLFESHFDTDYDTIIALVSPKDVQIDRMMRTRGYSRTQAEARIAAQMSVAEKAARAHFVVMNDSTPVHLRDEARRLVVWLKERAKDEYRRTGGNG